MTTEIVLVSSKRDSLTKFLSDNLLNKINNLKKERNYQSVDRDYLDYHRKDRELVDVISGLQKNKEGEYIDRNAKKSETMRYRIHQMPICSMYQIVNHHGDELFTGVRQLYLDDLTEEQISSLPRETLLHYLLKIKRVTDYQKDFEENYY